MKTLGIGIAMVLSALINPQHALARTFIGTEGGNGGDLCEARIYEIRNDIFTWVNNGGARGLNFPPAWNQSLYEKEMKRSLMDAKVSCTNEILKIGKAEKTCINMIQDGQARINCNINRLSAASDSDQYVLIHHEYAGLAGLETNNGEISNYETSHQLTKFLVQAVVTRLAVKPVAGNIPVPDAFLQDRFSELFISVLNSELLPANCDLSGAQKSFQVNYKSSYIYDYVGDKVCLREDSAGHPFLYRYIDFRTKTNYVVNGRADVITPRSIAVFSGKVIYPPDTQVQQRDLENIAQTLWKILREDVNPQTMKVTPNSEGGFDLRMEGSIPSIGFVLTVKAEFVSVGLSTDPKRLVVNVDYKIII